MSEHGTFLWYELETFDQKVSGTFYSDLLGWTRKEMDMGKMGTYTIFENNGKGIAGMMNTDSPSKKPHWLPYIEVDNVDARTKKAVELGGKVLMEPYDIPKIGRMSLLADPTGAVFAIMKPAMEYKENM